MQKPIFTTAVAAIALAAVTASPAQARYLQTDPIGYEDDVNLYAYVVNDPVNSIDPTGNRAEVRAHIVDPTDTVPIYHLKIVLIPDNPSDFEGQENFKNKNAAGEIVATIGAGPEFVAEGNPLNLVAVVNRSSDIGEYLNGNDILVATVTHGEGDTDTNMINQFLGAANSYDGVDNYGIANAFGLGGDPNSNSFITGVLQRMGGDIGPVVNGSVITPGAGDPMNAQDLCNPGESGCRQP